MHTYFESGHDCEKKFLNSFASSAKLKPTATASARSGGEGDCGKGEIMEDVNTFWSEFSSPGMLLVFPEGYVSDMHCALNDSTQVVVLLVVVVVAFLNCTIGPSRMAT